MRFIESSFGRGVRLGVLLAATSLGCAATQGGSANTPEIALKRGSAWATYTLKPPQITGPTASLVLESGHLKGLLASRSLDVEINPDGAKGYGPGGPVNLSVAHDSDGTHVDGMWNGAPVNFLFSPARVKGSVVVWQGRLASQQASCGYNLDKIEPNGAVSGSSTCAGMPQETRLEVHAATVKVLKPTELAVFLVAALSAPPVSPNERRL
jgi:hypothetical protein